MEPFKNIYYVRSSTPLFYVTTLLLGVTYDENFKLFQNQQNKLLVLSRSSVELGEQKNIEQVLY